MTALVVVLVLLALVFLVWTVYRDDQRGEEQNKGDDKDVS